MKSYQEDLTFTGAAAQQSANPSTNRIAAVYIEPFSANAHAAYIGMNSGGTLLNVTASPPTGVTKRLGAPSSATAAVDNFKLEAQDATNRFTIGDFDFGGTTGEGIHITWFEA